MDFSAGVGISSLELEVCRVERPVRAEESAPISTVGMPPCIPETPPPDPLSEGCQIGEHPGGEGLDLEPVGLRMAQGVVVVVL